MEIKKIDNSIKLVCNYCYYFYNFII